MCCSDRRERGNKTGMWKVSLKFMQYKEQSTNPHFLSDSRCMFLFGEVDSFHGLLITSQQAHHIISKGKLL